MNQSQSPVFDETYQFYLNQIGRVDYLAKAEMLGLKRDGTSLIVPLYDRKYSLSSKGVRDLNGGKLTPAVRVMICKYVLHCTEDCASHGEDKFVTYREFKDAAPLTSYFATNTNKTLESTFSGKLALLEKRSLKIEGEMSSSDMYDLSVQFFAFPKIPVVMNFNDADDLFPAQCSILYRASADRYLDMECLSMTGTLLTGKLISI